MPALDTLILLNVTQMGKIVFILDNITNYFILQNQYLMVIDFWTVSEHLSAFMAVGKAASSPGK